MVNIAEQTSLAQQLASSGFRKTSIARAIAELVGSYISDSTSIDGALLGQLQATNSQATWILQDQPMSESRPTHLQSWILVAQPVWESRPADLQSWALQQVVPELKKAA